LRLYETLLRFPEFQGFRVGARLYNKDITKGKLMKSEIIISTEMIARFIADEEIDLADYQARGNIQMAYFATGRIAVWQSLLDVYAN
jgi:hypothetical protein